MNQRFAFLDDRQMLLELREAQKRETTYREECRKNESNYRGEDLYPLLCEAEIYVRECVDEIENRKRQGKWNPDQKKLFRVFPKFQRPQIPGSSTRPISKADKVLSESEPDPEGTRIIVVEDGALRPLRPGDLVHEPKRKK